MRRTKAEAEETRNKVLEAAEMLFFEHGPAAVTFDMIASTAGVTRGAIYWHFANKSDLLRALHDFTALPAEEIFARSLESGNGDPLAFIPQVTLECLRIIAGDIQKQRIYTIFLRCDYRGEFLSVFERDREMGRKFYDQLVGLFELARDKGSLKPMWNPPVAAKSYYCLVTGLLFEWLKDRTAFDLVANGEEILEAFFQGFRR